MAFWGWRHLWRDATNTRRLTAMDLQFGFFFLVVLGFILSLFVYARYSQREGDIARQQALLDEFVEKTDRQIAAARAECEILESKMTQMGVEIRQMEQEIGEAEATERGRR